MKLQFDSNLTYQQEAIASVVDLFEGLAGQGYGATQDFSRKDALLWNELGIGNTTMLPQQSCCRICIRSRNEIPFQNPGP